MYVVLSWKWNLYPRLSFLFVNYLSLFIFRLLGRETRSKTYTIRGNFLEILSLYIFPCSIWFIKYKDKDLFTNKKDISKTTNLVLSLKYLLNIICISFIQDLHKSRRHGYVEAETEGTCNKSYCSLSSQAKQLKNMSCIMKSIFMLYLLPCAYADLPYHDPKYH